MQRQHRAALEELGERTYEQVRAGALPEGPISTEIAAVESKLIEIEAKVAEVESLRTEEEGEEGEAPARSATEATETDPSRAAFPMVDGPAPAPGPGPGWEAAERFFGPSPAQGLRPSRNLTEWRRNVAAATLSGGGLGVCSSDVGRTPPGARGHVVQGEFPA